MRITSAVDLPGPLLKAAREKRLALFIGAGVSVAQPANLPMFDELTADVAARLGHQFDGKDPSQFLGTLTELHGPLVKELVHTIIANPQSKPNGTHLALAKLSVATRAPIVSTNYDQLIDRAAEAEDLSLGDHYVAPALPLGQQFNGIVYLHGALSRPPSELVVTDEDFGRAYLTQGWARRFAQDLFTNWTVLFVGYSHKDVVMTYLARGLPANTARYVLTDEPDSDRWRTLKITPIEYPPTDGHAALPQALEAWAKLEGMGQLEHFARAKDLASGTPPQIPEELAYLEEAISTPAGARGFVASADGPSWLQWVEEQKVFRALFAPGECDDESSRVLGQWFVDKYVANSEQCFLAAGTLSRLGTTVSEYLHWRIAAAIPELHRQSQDEARRWTAILSSALSTYPVRTNLWFSPYLNPQTGADLLPALRQMLIPRLTISEHRSLMVLPDEDGIETPQPVKVEVTWPAEKNALKRLWEVLRLDIDVVGRDVLQMAEQALRHAYQLATAFDPDGNFDSWSFRRSAIEDHPQDLHSDNEPDSIIDMLRDTALSAAGEGTGVSKHWLESPYALFRRLGIHLIAESADLKADTKAAIVETSLLYDHDVKHELFRLLSVVAADLTPNGRAQLLGALLRGPSEQQIGGSGSPEYRSRVIFDRVEWTRRHVESWAELDLALQKILHENPDMGVRDHPDFDSYLTSGVWGGSLPMTIEEFTRFVDADGPSTALQTLINGDYSERDFADPTWGDACRLVSDAVQARSDMAPGLIRASLVSPFAKHTDLTGAVLRGWAQSASQVELGEGALILLSHLALRQELARPLSEMLNGAARKALKSGPPLTLATLDGIARTIWERHSASMDPGGWSDSLMRGLNTWPGILAQYWLNRISARWQLNPDGWRGLSETETHALTTMLDPHTAAGSAASSILTGKLHFLFAADPAFAAAHLFVLFDPDRSAFAAEAWYSFLHEPRTPPDLLDAGFWDIVVRSTAIATAAGEKRLSDRYWLMIASITIHSTAESVNRAVLTKFLSDSTTSNQFADFLDAIAHYARDLDETAKTNLWDSWLLEALAYRQNSATPLQPLDEKAAWADLGLEAEMLPLIERAATTPGPLSGRTSYSGLSNNFIRSNAETLVTTAIDRLRVTVDIDWHVRLELGALVDAVKGAARPETIRELAELAFQRGIVEALNWADEAD